MKLAPHLAFRLCLFMALAPSHSAAASMDNTSFETGPDPGDAMQLASGSTAITGWTVTRNPIDYVGLRWAAWQGARSLGLNGAAPGGITQTVATVPGQVYTVHFFMSGDAFSTPVIKNLRVEAAGQSQDYAFDTTHAWPWDMGWLEKTFAFTASTASTRIEFYSLDTGDTGPALDQITLEGPPVDATWAGRLEIGLGSPYPNPAPQALWVDFTLPRDTPVRLSVWDVRGREVGVLDAGTHPAGHYTRLWDGNVDGRAAPAGLYLLRLETPGATLVRKAVLSR
jgi:choice-of-anchor C domain-containing protein